MGRLEDKIRTIPDFPKPGIQFKDITPLLSDTPAFAEVINRLKERHAGRGINQVVGVESRGFLLAAPLAYALGAGVTLVRKSGKLPHTVHQKTYDLEYGTDTLEIHTDAFNPRDKILLVDDLLATGGTVAACVELIEAHFEVEIVEANFLIELSFLRGRERFKKLPVHALITY